MQPQRQQINGLLLVNDARQLRLLVLNQEKELSVASMFKYIIRLNDESRTLHFISHSVKEKR